MGRIAHLTMFLGDMGVQIGALTPMFYAMRDREFVLNQTESVSGGRFHPNFNRIGGLKDDLPKGWIEDAKKVVAAYPRFLDEFEALISGNEILLARSGRRMDPGRRGHGLFDAARAQRGSWAGAERSVTLGRRWFSFG